ncbi:BnaC03g61860D [Brassica napus]|uniref:BnaC03g61860D protein n=2 Tax=Brassica TaxID=3705 RepID=A0A078HDG8_BRANA|nr:BnaC03g61860D [Brassica napus]
MTKSKPNKKENKSKTSEEPTHRKPQQETIATDF